jgi:hypothetical protein
MVKEAIYITICFSLLIINCRTYPVQNDLNKPVVDVTVNNNLSHEQIKHNPGLNYYGADLTQFPPQIRDWIINEAFTREKMEGPYMINPRLRVWWGNDNNSVLTEASYTVARGYAGAGSRRIWGQGSYRGSSNLYETYGEYARFQTLRFEWEQKQRAEKMYNNDPAFAEIIDFAKRLCREIEYDWSSFSGYRGPVRRTPNLRYAVCDGYANEVMDKALRLTSVSSVQKWSSSGHSWNILKLTDGRTLYFDLTWFDNEHINRETGIIYQTEDYGWLNITFNDEVFRFSNVGYGTRVFHHNIGRLVREVRKNPNAESRPYDSESSIGITNNTGYTVRHMYISPVSNDNWGRDVLWDGVVNNGNSVPIKLSQPFSFDNRYDIRIISENGNTYTKRNVFLSQDEIVRFTAKDMDVSPITQNNSTVSLPQSPDTSLPSQSQTYTRNTRSGRSNYYPEIPPSFVGYNYAPEMPIGFSIGVFGVYTSWNFALSSDIITEGRRFIDWVFTAGYSFKLIDGVLRLPVGIGMSRSYEYIFHYNYNKLDWDTLFYYEFIAEAGLQLILNAPIGLTIYSWSIDKFYLSATYRLIFLPEVNFSKSGFSIGAGFVF